MGVSIQESAAVGSSTNLGEARIPDSPQALSDENITVSLRSDQKHELTRRIVEALDHITPSPGTVVPALSEEGYTPQQGSFTAKDFSSYADGSSTHGTSTIQLPCVTGAEGASGYIGYQYDYSHRSYSTSDSFGYETSWRLKKLVLSSENGRLLVDVPLLMFNESSHKDVGFEGADTRRAGVLSENEERAKAFVEAQLWDIGTSKVSEAIINNATGAIYVASGAHRESVELNMASIPVLVEAFIGAFERCHDAYKSQERVSTSTSRSERLPRFLREKLF